MAAGYNMPASSFKLDDDQVAHITEKTKEIVTIS